MLLTMGKLTLKIHQVLASDVVYSTFYSNGEIKARMMIKRFSQLKRELEKHNTGAVAQSFDEKEGKILWQLKR